MATAGEHFRVFGRNRNRGLKWLVLSSQEDGDESDRPEGEVEIEVYWVVDQEQWLVIGGLTNRCILEFYNDDDDHLKVKLVELTLMGWR